MVNLEKLSIELIKNETPVFEPGETVKGKLIIINKERFKINKIVVQLKGHAFVPW